jgi:hypothetical protein
MRILLIVILAVTSLAAKASMVISPITTKPYLSKSQGGRVMAQLFTEDLISIQPPPYSGESNAMAKMLGEYRMRLNASRHIAQDYLYKNTSAASSEEVENYTKIMVLIAELQQNVFTSNWRNPKIGVKGTTNHSQNDINWVRYCFLVKILGDQQIKVAPPYTREDIDDALQFCNNFRELLSLPYYCSPSLRIPAEPPSGKVASRVLVPVGQPAGEVKPSTAVDSGEFLRAYAESEGLRDYQSNVNSIKKSLGEASISADRSFFQLLLSVSGVRKLPDELIASIDAATKPTAITRTSYASTRDYGKWLVQKARLKGGDHEALLEAGAWLLLADSIGADKNNFGPVLFDMHMRDADETTKSSARALFDSWRSREPAAK